MIWLVVRQLCYVAVAPLLESFGKKPRLQRNMLFRDGHPRSMHEVALNNEVYDHLICTAIEPCLEFRIGRWTYHLRTLAGKHWKHIHLIHKGHKTHVFYMNMWIHNMQAWERNAWIFFVTPYPVLWTLVYFIAIDWRLSFYWVNNSSTKKIIIWTWSFSFFVRGGCENFHVFTSISDHFMLSPF